MRAHRIAPCLALLAVAACAPEFTGPQNVKGLRLLAIQSEPPELGATADAGDPDWPPPSSAIRSLVGHPGFAEDGATRAIVLHLACTPRPGDLAGSACTQFANLSDPTQLFELLHVATACTDPGLGVVDAVTFSGVEACDRTGCAPFSVLLDPGDPSSAAAMPAPSYTLPAEFSFAGLAPEDPQRVVGLDVVDVALVIEATPAELAPAAAVPDACLALQAIRDNLEALWPIRPNLAAVKWLHVRGPGMPVESPPNHNPPPPEITLDGARLPAPGGTPAPATAGAWQHLLPRLPGEFEALRERYQRFDTNGHLIDTRDEEWAYSWFTTAGELDRSRTHASDEENALKVETGGAVLWLVVRDVRGGTSWWAAEILGH
jgi:hypothetical protein